MFHRNYKDKCFSGVSKKRASLRNDLPVKTESLIFRIPFLLKILRTPFLQIFRNLILALNKGEEFSAMNGVLRMLIFC